MLGADPLSLDETVDLGPYCSSSAPSVPDAFSLERAYMLFQSLGLRHLVVVDAGNRVKGMVTRKVRPGSSVHRVQTRLVNLMASQLAGVQLCRWQ